MSVHFRIIMFPVTHTSVDTFALQSFALCNSLLLHFHVLYVPVQQLTFISVATILQ